MTFVKICGLTDEASVDAALDAGADAVGFVSFDRSPRHVTVERAAKLAEPAAIRCETVLVTVNPGEDVALALRDGCAALSSLQMHGRESPQDVRHMATFTARRIIKAFAVCNAADLNAVAAFNMAERVLLDAKAPDGAARPGGHGAPFDWAVLADWSAAKPWILSGGLTPDNVANAIAATGASAVDVSSGVESAPGVKDLIKIRDFIAAAKAVQLTGRPIGQSGAAA